MAIWQYRFYLVDEDFKINKDDPYDIATSNLISEKKDVFLNELVQMLPISKHWDNHYVLYGDLERTCFELEMNTNQIDSIEVRLDLREIELKMIQNILDLISSYTLMIYDENHKLYFPDFVSLREHIVKSKAFKFVEDPVSFFENLK